MIGTQATGRIDGIVISAVSHEGLTVHVNGRPARLPALGGDAVLYRAGKKDAGRLLDGRTRDGVPA